PAKCGVRDDFSTCVSHHDRRTIIRPTSKGAKKNGHGIQPVRRSGTHRRHLGAHQYSSKLGRQRQENTLGDRGRAAAADRPDPVVLSRTAGRKGVTAALASRDSREAAPPSPGRLRASPCERRRDPSAGARRVINRGEVIASTRYLQSEACNGLLSCLSRSTYLTLTTTLPFARPVS